MQYKLSPRKGREKDGKDKVCVKHVFYYRIFINRLQMVDSKKILVGKIVAPQGLKGEFRVQTFTERPEDLKTMNAGVKFIRAARPNMAICKMDGIDDRNSAEKLRGTELFINHSDLPKLKKGEHYITDLIGMKVIFPLPRPSANACSPAKGNSKVAYVHNFGAGDILELDNGEMVSFNGANVDYEKKEIKI